MTWQPVQDTGELDSQGDTQVMRAMSRKSVGDHLPERIDSIDFSGLRSGAGVDGIN